MNSGEQERAQRISDYVDSLVVARRTEAEEERVRVYGVGDAEFPDLANLARELTRICLVAPGDFSDELNRRLVSGTKPRRRMLRLFVAVRGFFSHLWNRASRGVAAVKRRTSPCEIAIGGSDS
jgi:hypothetical protein